MRKIIDAPDDNGIQRMLLNNKFVFQYGPLDQGWWPDGLYTAPTDEALKFDIEKTKEMGFNMIRKHVKVEPARWYYYCDKMGMLVWQDMPSGDMGNRWEPRPAFMAGQPIKNAPRNRKIFIVPNGRKLCRTSTTFRALWYGCLLTKPGGSLKQKKLRNGPCKRIRRVW